VTIDPVEWAAGEKLFPYGRWREPQEAIERADAAIVQVSKSDLPSLPIPTFGIETVLDGIYRGSEAVPVESLRNRSITAFAGIAKPHRFFNTLGLLGITTAQRVEFRDHHAYTKRDLENLGGEIQITTEKDAVKLEDLDGGECLHLRISARIPDLDRFLAFIRKKLGP
jgi:tetraacyldisaccharide 4'-kinase